MKNKQILALFLAIVLIISSIPSVLVGAATGTVSKNTGVRHTLCTALSSQALTYYSTNNALFDNVSTLQGGSDNCLTTVNSPLFDELHDLMAETMTTSVSYSSLTEHWVDTDANNGSSQPVLFYSDITSSSYNREHVWPKSHASFHEKNGGCDPHHLRPTNSDMNSTRGNYCMGYVIGIYSGYKTKTNGNGSIYYSSSNDRVEVDDNVKGDVARILLYVYCRWEERNLFMNDPNATVGPSDEKNDGLKVIESLETLLEWCEMDPVDTWEMSRNDQCENLVGNRNVFIDYPEYAWLLFGEEVPTDMATPSGEASNGDLGGSGGTATCTHSNVKYVMVNEINHTVVCISCSKTVRTEAHTLTNNTCTPCGYTKTESGGDTPSTGGTAATFEFGSKTTSGHSDGSGLSASDSFTEGNRTLSFTTYTKAYKNARDAKGNACLKLGSDGTAGVLAFTVPNDVTSVTLKIAGYKTNVGKITLNATSYTVDTYSNNGDYTEYTVDTTTTKTVTLSTVSGGYRVMIDSITFKASSGGITPDEPETPTCQHTAKKYASLDGEEHSITCNSCNEALGSEAHKFTNNTCSLCGYQKPSTPVTPSTPSTVIFEFGANGTATHKDGSADSTTYTETVGSYTLKLTNGSKMFAESYDARGNSCIKLGSSSAVGKFTFTVPSEVTSVVIKVAGYKSSTVTVKVNGTSYAIKTASNNGDYTDVTVDTSISKTVAFETSTSYRAMIDSITYNIAVSHTHNYVESQRTEPSYFKDGILVKTCTCGDTQTTTLPKDTANPFVYNNITFYPESNTLNIKWSYTDAFLHDYIATKNAQPMLKFVYTTAGKTYETGSFNMADGESSITLSGLNLNRISTEFTFYFVLSWAESVDVSYINAAQGIALVTKKTVIPKEVISTENTQALDRFNNFLDEIEAATEQDVIAADMNGNDDFASSSLKLDIKNSAVTLRFVASNALIEQLSKRDKTGRTVTLYITINGRDYTVNIAKLTTITNLTISNLSFEQLNSNVTVKLGFAYTDSSLNFKTEILNYNLKAVINDSNTNLALAFKDYMQNTN